MSKLLSTLLIGAAAGIAAGAIIHKANERQLAGKPAVPSALVASLGGLLPLGQGLAQHVVDTLKAWQEPGPDQTTAYDHTTGYDFAHGYAQPSAGQGDAAAPEDGGDSMQQDSDGNDSAPTFTDETSTTAPDLVDHGHPAGPGFAPTPA